MSLRSILGIPKREKIIFSARLGGGCQSNNFQMLREIVRNEQIVVSLELQHLPRVLRELGCHQWLLPCLLSIAHVEQFSTSVVIWLEIPSHHNDSEVLLRIRQRLIPGGPCEFNGVFLLQRTRNDNVLVIEEQTPVL